MMMVMMVVMTMMLMMVMIMMMMMNQSLTWHIGAPKSHFNHQYPDKDVMMFDEAADDVGTEVVKKVVKTVAGTSQCTHGSPLEPLSAWWQ